MDNRQFKKRVKAHGRESNRIPPFVPMTWEMLNSMAYHHLPFSASKALPFFLGKVQVPYGDPRKFNTEFKFSYPEGKRLGFTFPTFSKAIRAVIGHGFVDLVEAGGLKGRGGGYNIFRLSKRWRDYGTERFQEAKTDLG